MPSVPEKEYKKGATVIVKHFILQGITLFPPEELQSLLHDRIGEPHGLAELEEAAQTVSEYYREQGYFARAYLPAQDITNGVVRIQVVEGRLGKITLLYNPNATRADDAYIERVVAHGLTPGQPYSARQLERGLLLANDLPGAYVNGTLKAGQNVGESDFGIHIGDTPLFTGSAGANNFSSKSTGTYQATAGVEVNSLSGIGDQVALHTVASEHLAYGRMEYSLPLGTDGLRAGVSGSYLAYELGDRFKSLDAEGSSHTLGAYLRYPLLRSVKHSLWGELEYGNRHYEDDALDTPLARKEVNAASFSLSGDRSDTYGGGGITRYHLQLTGGDLDLSELASALAADRLGPGTDGHYAKFTARLGRDQAVGSGWYLRGRTSAQWANTNLDSSEKFSLGGPYGVRAYPVNEALGDEGLLFSVELHKPIKSWDIYGFADAGAIRQYKDTWAGWNAGSGTPNTYWLGGAGIGATYALSRNASINAMLAVPIGANQGAAEQDNNQDGSHHGPRIWVGLTAYF